MRAEMVDELIVNAGADFVFDWIEASTRGMKWQKRSPDPDGSSHRLQRGQVLQDGTEVARAVARLGQPPPSHAAGRSSVREIGFDGEHLTSDIDTIPTVTKLGVVASIVLTPLDPDRTQLYCVAHPPPFDEFMWDLLADVSKRWPDMVSVRGAAVRSESSNAEPRQLTAREALWLGRCREWLTEFERGRMTKQGYAARNGFSERSLTRWMSTLRAKGLL